MTTYPHEFDARIVPHDVGAYRYTVVFLPPELADDLPLKQHPRLRASGEVGEVPFTGAWQPVRGRWYLMLSKALLRDAGAATGDPVRVRFRVEDQDAVEVPEDLARAIAADAVARRAWSELSAGRQRGLAYRVLSAKTPGTVQRRLLEVMDQIRGAQHRDG